jgi:hypothetical protein
MMKMIHALSLSVVLTSGAAFANQSASIQDLQKAVDSCQPCASDDPCACCSDADKAACTGAKTGNFVTVPSETGWQVIPRE